MNSKEAMTKLQRENPWLFEMLERLGQEISDEESALAHTRLRLGGRSSDPDVLDRELRRASQQFHRRVAAIKAQRERIIDEIAKYVALFPPPPFIVSSDGGEMETGFYGSRKEDLD